ncbi:hypothetical protein [Hydrogenophaga sp. RWCD_12]|uniref:hypothetical protein n=1 Tax=Hydrogenophaga sp. RWCD_12 TaxID=3391190 RepID=UPI003984B10A
MDGVDDKARRQASIAWFHDLAIHDRNEIARRCSPDTEALLRAHVALCLSGQDVPPRLTPEQFAEVVLDLRANERDWERAWMAAAVQADDRMLAGQVEEAGHVLSEFAKACPWGALRQEAQAEAERIGGRRDS